MPTATQRPPAPIEVTPALLRKVSERIRNDMVWGVQHLFQTQLYPKTREIIEAVQNNDQVAVASCHASGKSFIVARIALAFLLAYPGKSKVITTAPTDRQVKDILWSEIKDAYAQCILPLGGELLQQELKLTHSWFAKGFTARPGDLVAFQGYHAENLLIIGDEASGIEPSVWSAINTLQSGGNVKLLMIGNPTHPDGPFFDCFKRFTDSWYTIHISAFDTPNVVMGPDPKTGRERIPGLISRKYVKQMLRDYGEDSPLFQVRCLGQFPTETDNTLIYVGWVDRARDQPPPFDPLNDDMHAGLDVAYTGTDESALAIRIGTRLVKLTAWQGMDPMQTVARVRKELDPFVGSKRLQSIRVDEIGIGAGVAARLSELGYPVIRVNGANSARLDPDKINLRAEMWWNLRDTFRNGLIGGQIDPLTEHQLTSIKYEITSHNKIKIESKPDYKKRMRMSPDRAESILYAFADLIDPQLRSIDLPGFGEYDYGETFGPRRGYEEIDLDNSIPGLTFMREERRRIPVAEEDQIRIELMRRRVRGDY